MSLGHLNFDDISEADLTGLIETGVAEGPTLEYKGAPYGRSDADVKECLKDVSALANANGGHLVIGLEEKDGVAANLSPITTVDADSEILRLENLLRDGIEPRIVGIRMKSVPISTGGFAIVIRVPRSWNPPHRVSARNTNRFYIRDSAGAHEVSVEELRALFNVSATAQDRTRAFRQERIAKISAGETPIPLPQSQAYRGKFILHVVPLSAFSSRSMVDLDQANRQQALLRPMQADGYTPRFNFDGLILTTGSPTHSYTQLHRNGVIEAVRVRAIVEHDDGRRLIPSLDFDRYAIEGLPLYLRALSTLGVPAPLVVMLTLTDTRGAVLGISQEQFIIDPPAPISQPILELPEIVIDDYGSSEDYQRAVRPAFDALWNAGGFSSSRYFDPSGLWIGDRR
jgi:hypothetical protein